ncbi:hypothetical protein U5U50_00760 [Mycoplasma sp. 888]|uniref:hypothetical protein n=1 Tax=Mycoplasma sp. 888 TaxID=3108483 RepID=UPI002D77F0D1|nr:hypothetical protein [Mycoplasma sp. 888]WRQ25918.1 hypothetical protein U5U50_00760 [Mycoplasma sp. 888]
MSVDRETKLFKRIKILAINDDVELKKEYEWLYKTFSNASIFIPKYINTISNTKTIPKSDLYKPDEQILKIKEQLNKLELNLEINSIDFMDDYVIFDNNLPELKYVLNSLYPENNKQEDTKSTKINKNKIRL